MFTTEASFAHEPGTAEFDLTPEFEMLEEMSASEWLEEMFETDAASDEPEGREPDDSLPF